MFFTIFIKRQIFQSKINLKLNNFLKNAPPHPYTGLGVNEWVRKLGKNIPPSGAGKKAVSLLSHTETTRRVEASHLPVSRHCGAYGPIQGNVL